MSFPSSGIRDDEKNHSSENQDGNDGANDDYFHDQRMVETVPIVSL